MNLREDAVIGRVNKWLAREFAPHHMSETLRALAEAPQRDTTPADDGNTARKIADCDRRLVQYRAALDAGASPATVAAWIAETEAEKASALASRFWRPMVDRTGAVMVDRRSACVTPFSVHRTLDIVNSVTNWRHSPPRPLDRLRRDSSLYSPTRVHRTPGAARNK